MQHHENHTENTDDILFAIISLYHCLLLWPIDVNRGLLNRISDFLQIAYPSWGNVFHNPSFESRIVELDGEGEDVRCNNKGAWTWKKPPKWSLILHYPEKVGKTMYPNRFTDRLYGCRSALSASSFKESNEYPMPLWPINSSVVRVIQWSMSISFGPSWSWLVKAFWS